MEKRKIPGELIDESEVGFELGLRQAIAMQNDLSTHFSLEGVNKKGEKDHREEDAQVSFVARPPDRTCRKVFLFAPTANFIEVRKLLVWKWRPRRDSNPRYRRERAMS